MRQSAQSLPSAQRAASPNVSSLAGKLNRLLATQGSSVEAARVCVANFVFITLNERQLAVVNFCRQIDDGHAGGRVECGVWLPATCVVNVHSVIKIRV